MNFIYLFLSVVLLTTHVFSSSLVGLSGSVTSGFWGKNQDVSYVDNARNIQFETAANLNVEAIVDDSVTVGFDLEMGDSNSVLEFAEGIGVFPYIIVKQNSNLEYRIGSFTVPIGQVSDLGTGNAHYNSLFLVNDLGYSFLSDSAVQTFDSTGANVSIQSNHGDIDIAAFNGTDTDSSNEDGGFGVAFRYQYDLNGVIVGGSYMGSNDYGDDSAIDANLTVTMVDASTTFYGFNLFAYYGLLDANDYDSSTDDSVTIYAVSASTTLPELLSIKGMQLGTKISGWGPDDYNGDSTGISSALEIPGFAESSTTDTIPNDQDITRYDFTLMIPIKDQVSLSNHIIYDDYGNNDYDSLAVMSFVSVDF